MRYKIVKKNDKFLNGDVKTFYYVMKEVKLWYRRNKVWKYCKETTYASYDSGGQRVYRENLKDAEDYIKNRIKTDNTNFKEEDVKIYECRESKIDKLLDNE